MEICDIYFIVIFLHDVFCSLEREDREVLYLKPEPVEAYCVYWTGLNHAKKE